MALFFVATVLCYIDRVSISVAIIPLARERGFDAAAQGLVLSAFFWGYMWPQLAGGWIADRIGGRRVLAAGVAVWSFATLITPLASVHFAILLAARVILGLGEGVNFPAIHSLAATWTPPSEQSRAVALNFSGMHLGTVIAFLLGPPLMVAFGWQSLFYISGLAGAVWVVVWMMTVAERPELAPGISAEELAEIHAGRFEMAPSDRKPLLVPWSKIAGEKAVWAIILAHFCSNFGFNILLLWLPTYLSKTFSLSLIKVGTLSLVPWITTFAASNAGGWIADTMRRRGVPVGTIRRQMQAVAFTGGALPLFILPAAPSPVIAVMLVTISAACSGTGLAAFGVNHLDISPRFAGVLMGLSNTIATIPGIVGVAAAGFIWRASGSFAAVFYVIACVYLIGMAGYVTWAGGEERI